MGWKDWPYWLKWIIIGIIYSVITFPLALLLGLGGSHSIFFKIILFPYTLPTPSLQVIHNVVGSILYYLFVNLLIFFLIGWIYGKIKKK